MNRHGFIKLSRKFFGNELWTQPRVYSQAEAWIDLIQLAYFDTTPKKKFIGNIEVSWQRGQYPASIRYLAKKWEWSPATVRSFLNRLQKREMITLDHSQGMNIITLCKYDLHNLSDTVAHTAYSTRSSIANPNTDRPLDLAVTQQKHNLPHSKNTNIKKEKEGKEEKKNTPPTSPEGAETDNNKYDWVMNEFNRIFSGKIPPIHIMDEKRKKTIDWRIKDYGTDSIDQVFENLFNAPFWQNKQAENEKIDFDWIMRRRNYVKLLEKNFKNLYQNGKYKKHLEPEEAISAGIKSHTF